MYDVRQNPVNDTIDFIIECDQPRESSDNNKEEPAKELYASTEVF